MIQKLVLLSFFYCLSLWAAPIVESPQSLTIIPKVVLPSPTDSKPTSIQLAPNSNLNIYVSSTNLPAPSSPPPEAPKVAIVEKENKTSQTTLIMPKDIKPKTIKIEPISSLDIHISPEYMNSPKVKKLFNMMHIKKIYPVIHIVDTRTIGRYSLQDNIISARPRSFMGMMDYLSNGVQVSKKVLDQGLVLAPLYKNGCYYNLNEITKGLFFVHMSTQRPHENVNVEVFYRNHWFYVKDNDIQTKRTIALVEQIFGILSGTQASQTPKPVLTIPIR